MNAWEGALSARVQALRAGEEALLWRSLVLQVVEQSNRNRNRNPNPNPKPNPNPNPIP